MIFNSVEYAIFLPICVSLYYIIPSKYKKYYLLLVSYYFYMCWEPKYVVLLLVSTIVTWVGAILLERGERLIFRKGCLLFGVIINIGILFVFKYYNFFVDILVEIFPIINWNKSSLLLPVGISFYTFQTLSYIIDVYRSRNEGRKVAEKNLWDYALYISFFPQLVAGPIERHVDMLYQLKNPRKFSQDNIVVGLRIVLVGMFKKVVIADMIAMFVDSVYGNYQEHSGGVFIVAMCLFSLQIYCDFSGYSDIARGSARMLGINLSQNFMAPYLATNMKDFWNRWHISLNTWFRDYIYIPLGGNRRGHKNLNLMMVFMLSGLWHGAAYHFVLWGLLNGGYRVTSEILQKFKGTWHKEVNAFNKVVAAGIVFIVQSFTWNLFRADNVEQAFRIYASLLNNMSLGEMKRECISVITSFMPGATLIGAILYISIILIALVILFYFDIKKDRYGMQEEEVIDSLKMIYRWGLYYGLTICIMFCFVLTTNELGQAGAFIYFQF